MKIMQEEHDVLMMGQHGENGSNKSITITFDVAKLLLTCRLSTMRCFNSFQQ
jgi:hypothetical protein